VLVATPFVAELLQAADPKDPDVKLTSSWIQAAFLIGWALGGGFFGRIADRLGRSRALMLTILTYAAFTGLSYFAQTWWQLLVFRFLAALGIGGEWAVGASLLSETWPTRWRPWMAAVLQSAVNIGVMLACVAYFLLAGSPPRTVFLVGILPALLVLWIRRSVPEPDVWRGAKREAGTAEPHFADLFRGPVRRTTILTLLVCGLALTAHWVFMFWCLQHLRTLAEFADWSAGDLNRRASMAFWLIMVTSIVGNFLAAALARWLGYRPAIALLCVAYFLSMTITYGTQRGPDALWFGLAAGGISQGVFALFTMYMPPLFPTLLRTTGAGFCYNIGRIAAGLGTVIFGLFFTAADSRLAIFWAAFLFLPAAAIACFLSEPPDEALPLPEEGPLE
jgi:MFS family permease